MYKIKHRATAVETKHKVLLWLHGNRHEITYKVVAIQGIATHAPQNDEPVVFLQLSERTSSPAQPFITLTLSMLAENSEPVSNSDLFYEPIKTKHA
jgi:hypothetical protein